jgi:hypothetical protein
MAKIPVTFLRAHHVYNGGETAGFEPAEAQRLVDAGVAEFLNAPDAKAASAPDRRPVEPPTPAEIVATGDADALNALTKDVLAEQAKAVFGLDIPPDTKKAEMVVAIMKARAPQA